MSKYIEMFHNIICLDDIYRVFVKHNYKTKYRENMPYNEHILAIIFKDKEEIVFNSFDIDEIDREYEKLKNALIENNELCNDIDDEPCDSEAKRIINAVKQGKLPPIPSVDNQSTKGLVTSDTYDSEAKRIIKCVEENKLPPIFDEGCYR